MRGGGSGDRGAPFGAGRGKGELRGCPRGLEKGWSLWEAEQTCCQGFRETVPSTERVLAIPSFVQWEFPFVPRLPLVLKIRSDPGCGTSSAEKHWTSILTRSAFIVGWSYVPLSLSIISLL